MEGFDIVLRPGFSTPRNEVLESVVAACASGRELAIEFKIAGQYGLTELSKLAEQFLYAASIGEEIAEACSKFACEAPSSIQAHESVEFYVVPRDAEEFMTRLWDSIPALMSPELLAQNDHDEDLNIELVTECWGGGWDLLESPETARHTGVLIRHAQQLLEAGGGYADEDDDEEDEWHPGLPYYG